MSSCQTQCCCTKYSPASLHPGPNTAATGLAIQITHRPSTSWAFFYVIHSSQLSFFASQFIRWKNKVTGQGHTVSLSLNPSSSGIVFLPLPSHTDFSALRVPPAIIFVLIAPLALVQYVFSVSSASCAAQTPLEPILQQVQPILLSVSQIHLLSSSSATALLRPQHTSHG